MVIEENVSLKSFNSFGIDAKAKYFVSIENNDHLLDLMRTEIFHREARLILGGGSNILFVRDFDGLVVRMNTRGIEQISSESNHVYVRAMAGENWEDYINFCLKHNFGGTENLTMIPGNVGTSPMQNIGAYGVELKDNFYSLDAFEISSGKIITFGKDDCSFGYRNSFFKHEGRDKYIILSVIFRLTLSGHKLILDYGPVRSELHEMGIPQPGIMDVCTAIRNIRSRKLPDPRTLGNAGSFFKNPVVNEDVYSHLKNYFPELPSYPVGLGLVKIPAAWLIEQAGWKGFRRNDAGVHKNQALVLVNYGNAQGREILQLSEDIASSVYNKFNVLLEREVNVVGDQAS